MVTLSYYPTHHGPRWSVLIGGAPYIPATPSAAEAKAALRRVLKAHPHKTPQAWNGFTGSLHRID